MKRAIIVFISFLALVALVTYSRPTLDSLFPIFLFFLLLYIFSYQSCRLVLDFLGVRKNTRLMSAVAAGSITGIQVMMTFRALRIIDMLLLVSVVIVVTWYVSKART